MNYILLSSKYMSGTTIPVLYKKTRVPAAKEMQPRICGQALPWSLSQVIPFILLMIIGFLNVSVYNIICA